MRTLTIAELWAIPQMLRIALIEGIQDLAARGLAELREREIADFWANRLITANRRDPNHLFAIMAELAESQAHPSPYFASQLIDTSMTKGPRWPGAELAGAHLSQAPQRAQLARAEPPDQGSDLHRQCLHQPAPARPAGLEGRSSSSSAGWSGHCGRIPPASMPGWISPRVTGTAARLRSLPARSGQAEEKVAQGAIDLAARAATQDDRGKAVRATSGPT